MTPRPCGFPRRGSHWPRSSSRRISGYYAKKAGMAERVTPHAFRHAFATHLLRHGADIRAVSKMLGHSRLKVTQIYTHLAQVDVKEAHEETHPREKDKVVRWPSRKWRSASMSDLDHVRGEVPGTLEGVELRPRDH